MSNSPSDPTAAQTFERTYAEATESVRREVLRMREKAERFRAEYRAELTDWMALRASIDHRSGGSTARGTADSLRTEYDRVGRELAVFQARLKRLDTAARGVELLAELPRQPRPRRRRAHARRSGDVTRRRRPLRVIAAQEAERQRLAEEVHDGPAQVLTNAIFQVEYLDRVLETRR